MHADTVARDFVAMAKVEKVTMHQAPVLFRTAPSYANEQSGQKTRGRRQKEKAARRTAFLWLRKAFGAGRQAADLWPRFIATPLFMSAESASRRQMSSLSRSTSTVAQPRGGTSPPAIAIASASSAQGIICMRSIPRSASKKRMKYVNDTPFLAQIVKEILTL
jgi:hypothetical protein